MKFVHCLTPNIKVESCFHVYEFVGVERVGVVSTRKYQKNTPSYMHFRLYITHIYEFVGIERVGVVSTRKYTKLYVFWTLQHFVSTSSLALNVLALCLREIRQAIYIFWALQHFIPLRQDAPYLFYFYFQVRKRPKIPSFACHVANYNTPAAINIPEMLSPSTLHPSFA